MDACDRDLFSRVAAIKDPKAKLSIRKHYVATLLHRQAESGEGDASRPDDATSGAVRDVPLVGAYRGSSGRGLSPPRAESSGATAASMAAHAPGGLVRRVRAADPSQPRMSARSAKGIERITGNVRSIEPS